MSPFALSTACVKFTARGLLKLKGEITRPPLQNIERDCRTILQDIPDNAIDLIATDPPYFIHGMGDEWSDKKLRAGKTRGHAIGGLPVGMKFDPEQGLRLESFMTEVAMQARRVLKPGAFFLAFSQPRLSHRMAIALENAGFEIRDQLIWEHQGGQGKAFSQDHFVEKMDISAKQKSDILKRLKGRKTPQLRPKFETIILAQNPRDGTFVENFMAWGTGLIDLDFDPRPTTVFAFDKPKREKTICLGPLKVSHYLLTKGVTKNGTEAVFR